MSIKAIILTPVGFIKGNKDSEFQYYQLLSKDSEGRMFISTLGCRNNHTESIEKALSRIFMVNAPNTVLTEGADKDGTKG